MLIGVLCVVECVVCDGVRGVCVDVFDVCVCGDVDVDVVVMVCWCGDDD